MLKNRLIELMAEYAQEVGTSAQSALRDIMTDLRHIADDQDLDFDYAGIASEEVYLEENPKVALADDCGEDRLMILTRKKMLTPVEVCIVYIESCGWRLRARARGYYFFYNENAPIGMRDKTFSLKELRETYKTGW